MIAGHPGAAVTRRQPEDLSSREMKKHKCEGSMSMGGMGA